MIDQKMQKRFYKEKHITGMNGVYVVDVIVYMFGLIQLHWNYPMDRMDGFVLFSMENWQRCIQVEVPKMETITLVFIINLFQNEKNNFFLSFSNSFSFRLAICIFNKFFFYFDTYIFGFG